MYLLILYCYPLEQVFIPDTWRFIEVSKQIVTKNLPLGPLAETPLAGRAGAGKTAINVVNRRSPSDIVTAIMLNLSAVKNITRLVSVC